MPISDAQAATIEHSRCTDVRGGRRCQLLAGHGRAHAATLGPDTRCRWDDAQDWAESTDVTRNAHLARLRWSPSFPHVEG